MALDNEVKNNKDKKAECRYEEIPATLWKIPKLTDFWGIGHRTEKRFNKLGFSLAKI